MSKKNRNRDISARRRRKAEKGFPWSYVLPFIVLIVVVGSILYVSAQNHSSTTTINIAGFPYACLPNEGTVLHVHPWLRIIISGMSVTIPSQIGIVGGLNACLEPMHTHDDSGIIHIESPDATTQFTLGAFFQIWDVTYPNVPFNGTNHPIVFNSTDILGYRTDATHHLTLLVDNKTNSEFGALILNQYDYCNATNGGSFPCAATAGGNPIYPGQNFGSGHTVEIEYGT